MSSRNEHGEILICFFIERRKKEEEEEEEETKTEWSTHHKELTFQPALDIFQPLIWVFSVSFYIHSSERKQKTHRKQKTKDDQETKWRFIWSYHGWESVTTAVAVAVIDEIPVEWCSSQSVPLFAVLDEPVDDNGEETNFSSTLFSIKNYRCHLWRYNRWTLILMILNNSGLLRRISMLLIESITIRMMTMLSKMGMRMRRKYIISNRIIVMMKMITRWSRKI